MTEGNYQDNHTHNRESECTEQQRKDIARLEIWEMKEQKSLQTLEMICSMTVAPHCGSQRNMLWGG